MPADDPAADRLRKGFVLAMVLGITVLFLVMIRGYLLAVLLAAIFAGLSSPLYLRLTGWLGGRKALAAVGTILILVLGVAVPLAGFLAVAASEAVQVSQGAGDWLQQQAPRLEQLRGLVERIPFADRIIPDSEELADQFRELAGRTGSILMGKLAAATRGTLSFFLQLFILLYSLFFFLVDGPTILRRILYYVPLSHGEEDQLLERFVSVARATLKGSLLIGIIQGGLAGVAFWVAGIPGSAFWGAVMVVLSVIPAVGAALVWIPAVLYLYASGVYLPATLLMAWCAVVVGTVDNFLRPRLIGRDARMSDLLILLSTLGGIGLFGAVGFIVGPIVAALFVTAWHIYGEAFGHILPPVPQGAEAPAEWGGRQAEGEAEAAAGG